MGATAASAAPKLLPFLSHADWRVRLEAARTLGLSRAKEAVEALRRALNDEEDLVRKAVEEALNSLAGAT